MNGAASLVLTAILAVSSAQAACTAPTPPDLAGRPSKPAPPVRGPCVDARPGTSGCLGWEPHRYNEEVRAFNEQAAGFQKAAQAYVDQLNAYVRASGDYAQCEVKALN